jgi:serine-type D-Ala-D-Ala carboxypeptidase/endopeptidase
MSARGRARALAAALVTVAIIAGCGGPAPVSSVPRTGAETRYRIQVDELVAPLVRDEWVAGVVVGLIDRDGIEFHSYGRRMLAPGQESARPPGPDTAFEIGAVSSLLAAALLAEGVARGQIGLREPLSGFVPAGRELPMFGEQEINFEHLATHSSGLPPLPTNLASTDPTLPFAGYTIERLYDFLQGYQLDRAPGARYEYSAVGAGLLGDIVARREQGTWPAVLAARLTGPLNMQRTAVGFAPVLQGDRASGHDVEGNRVADWEPGALIAATGLVSTARDLMSFVRANLWPSSDPLGNALTLAQRPRLTTGVPPGSIGLGWHIDSGGTVRWASGKTAGFSAFVALEAGPRLGVVVLANTATPVVDRLGRALISMVAGRPFALALPAVVSLAPHVVARYPGDYKLADGTMVRIVQDGARLALAQSDQVPVKLYPATETEFHARALAARVSFQLVNGEEVAGFVLDYGHRTLRALRQ